MWGSHLLESIDCLNENQILKLEETMSRVYTSFTLLIRNVIENSDVRDQLILSKNQQVGICFKRRQGLKPGGSLDHDLQCFMPADPLHKGIVTLNVSDIFEVEHGRPDPCIPNSMRTNLSMKLKPQQSSLPIQQITVILLDISESMFIKISNTNTISQRFIDISIRILMLISQNLHRQSCSHAIGIILFGKNVTVHCPITTNIDEFEKSICKIPKHGQPWTSMYDAINTGLDHICQYESNNSVVYNCDKLIICITDGINNRGKLTIDNLKQKLPRTKIVLDLIFFSSNTITSHSVKERESITAFRQLCARTGGIIYRNSSVEPIDLATTFEQEAVLWLKARKRRNKFGCGIGISVNGPIAKEPEKLYRTAINIQIKQKFSYDASLKTDFFQRLQTEANGVVRQNMENIHLYVSVGNNDQIDYTFWKVILEV